MYSCLVHSYPFCCMVEWGCESLREKENKNVKERENKQRRKLKLSDRSRQEETQAKRGGRWEMSDKKMGREKLKVKRYTQILSGNRKRTTERMCILHVLCMYVRVGLCASCGF